MLKINLYLNYISLILILSFYDFYLLNHLIKLNFKKYILVLFLK